MTKCFPSIIVLLSLFSCNKDKTDIQQPYYGSFREEYFIKRTFTKASGITKAQCMLRAEFKVASNSVNIGNIEMNGHLLTPSPYVQQGGGATNNYYYLNNFETNVTAPIHWRSLESNKGRPVDFTDDTPFAEPVTPLPDVIIRADDLQLAFTGTQQIDVQLFPTYYSNDWEALFSATVTDSSITINSNSFSTMPDSAYLRILTRSVYVLNDSTQSIKSTEWMRWVHFQ